jgi:hypothetical protein
MLEIIENIELTESDLPPPRATWRRIQKFAITFNGYEYHGEFLSLANVANEATSIYRKYKRLPAGLSDLRACLFFESRRWHHLGGNPHVPAMIYVRALVEKIRGIVRFKRMLLNSIYPDLNSLPS